MPVVRADLGVYAAEQNNDLATNGGRLTAALLASGVAGNAFQDAGEAERLAGSLKYRKVFWKNSNIDTIATDAGLAFQNINVFVERFTAAADDITIFKTAADDEISTQADILTTEDLYGCGQLDANTTAVDTSIDVLVHDGAQIIFRNGDTIRISNKADIDAAGVTRINTINGVPTVLGNVVTIPLLNPVGAVFSTADTRVASLMPIDNLVASVDGVVVTSVGGTFSTAAPFFRLHNQASITQTWTLSFTSATDFQIAGDVLGVVGTGSVSSNTEIVNPDFAARYFRIEPSAFGGTFAPGDTIQFATHPSAFGFWLRRDIPAGTASFAGNESCLAITGESA